MSCSKSLKSQIKIHVETIQILQNIAERHQAQAESTPDAENYPPFVLMLEKDVQLAIVGLGESMVENEKVADEVTPNEKTPNKITPNETIPNQTIPNDIIPAEIIPDEKGPDKSVLNKRLLGEKVSEKKFSNEKILDRFNIKQKKTDYSTHELETYSTEDSFILDERLSLSPGKSNYTIYEIDSDVIKCLKVSGFVNMFSRDCKDSHWRAQDAIIFDNVNTDLVSTAFVDSLGAPVLPIPKNQKDIWIDFKFEKGLVIGTSWVFWKSSLEKQNSAREVPCLVYESSYKTIIFGKWARSPRVVT
jgi:hypothetical protein